MINLQIAIYCSGHNIFITQRGISFAKFIMSLGNYSREEETPEENIINLKASNRF